ncbi:hypothetical protein [Kribbella sindirgiensis]|uniref:Minor tail protein n=1 Tax=Kribbella sindirgiensis TaxID=1124744 RepID=A0A4R0I3M3_9ACTN|nr:hypothetical protein [Kribbella sindirgiensis]TCC19967.1 hypothetical protein E0H50_37720 [Kribbella sindirgiensis]
MPYSSFPFDNQDTTETQYSKLFRELQASGVADTYGGSALRVDATGGMNIAIQAGFAIVRGHGFLCDAAEPLTIPAAGSSQVIHTVVLRLDPSVNSIVPAVVSGVGGGGAPALVQTDSAIFEMPLFDIPVAPGAANVDPTKMVDRRRFLADAPGAWSTASRPQGPRYATLGYNTTISQWEFHNGVDWVPVVDPSIPSRVLALESQPYVNKQDAQILGAPSYVVPDATTKVLNWVTTEDFSGISYSSVTGRFVVSKAGWYRYDIHNAFNTSAADAGYRQLTLVKNDAVLVANDIRNAVKGGFTTLKLSGETYLSPSDFLTTSVRHTAGGTLGMISDDGYQHFTLRRVGS